MGLRVAVGHETSELDRGDSLEQRVVRDAPRAHGVVLGLTSLPSRRLVAVACPPEDASGCLLAGFTARGRRREEDFEVSLRARFRLTDCADDLRRPAVHPGRTLRRRRGENDAPQ
jgi:hypothetical protein